MQLVADYGCMTMAAAVQNDQHCLPKWDAKCGNVASLELPGTQAYLYEG